MQQYEYHASCICGAEFLLAAELKQFGAVRIRPLQAGVAFFGTLEAGYRACLWSRLASRVLLIIERVNAADAEELYASVVALPWELHIDPTRTIAVAARGVNEKLTDTRFIALKVKDALCDRLRAARGARPSVEKERPAVRIDVALRGVRATIALDLAGEPLHMRKYRVPSRHITAPLRETLGALMVMAAGWDSPDTVAGWDCVDSAASAYASAASACGVLLDPCCGSGTIAIEAALIALDRAPGILRDYWGFVGWLGHDENLWARLLDEADERAEHALNTSRIPAIYARDIDSVAIAVARESARKAGVEAFINFGVADIADTAREFETLEAKTKLVVTNPPYGQRQFVSSQLPALYAAFRSFIDPLLTKNPVRLAIITSDEDMQVYLGQEPKQRIKTYNGALETEILMYAPPDEATVEVVAVVAPGKTAPAPSDEAAPAPPADEAALSAIDSRDVEQFKNRLAKMATHRAKWARRFGISCYRVYDADLPSFAFAIDLYEGAGPDKGKRWLHIAEYAPPKHIETALAMQRLTVALNSAQRILNVPLTNIYLKTRQRAKGGSQYADLTEQAAKNPESNVISEAGLLFEVDFASHLDTGIFLDHRLTRNFLKNQAAGKDTLNLFAYTGTASVYMAAGGAKTVTTIDLSKTYLHTAQRNMALNGFTQECYRFEQAEALRWARDHRHDKQKYGLIFCDPPTFSNSTSMGKRTWDVQRDHAELLITLSRMLTPDGLVVFSTNLRDFLPELEPLQRAGVTLKDITAETIPEDFERRQKIHHCYIAQRVKAVPG